jgi:ABC-type tungstate transport system permease subunit
MNNKIEVLIIELFNQIIGIDCSEIKKVISNVSNQKDVEIIENYKKNNKYFKIGDIFKLKNEVEYNSFIIIDNDYDELMIAAPLVSSIISIDIYDLMLIPEYIKKNQEPFFVWGFIKNENRMITLVTFTYFLNKREMYGQK